VMATPVVALYLYLVWSGGAVGKPVFDWWFGMKLILPLLVMNGYSAPLAIGLWGTIAALLVFLGYNRVLGLTRPAIFIGSGFLIAYLLMPTRLFDSAYADVRLIPAIMLILPAFLTVRWPSHSVQSVAALMAMSVIVINLATVASVWFTYRGDYAEIIESFRLLRPGSTVLVARSDVEVGRLNAPIFYAPTLAAHYATAFRAIGLRAIRAHQESSFEIAFRNRRLA